MTTPLAARLAEVLRCNCSPTAIEGGGFIHDWACRHELRPAVLAFVEEELARERERCAQVADKTQADVFGLCNAAGDAIRALSARGE